MQNYAIFLAVKQAMTELGCPYTEITYDDMNTKKGNVAAIMVRNGQIPKSRMLSTGEFIRRFCRVQILIQTASDRTSVIAGSSFGTKLEQKMPLVFNRAFQLDTNKIGYDDDGDLSTIKDDIIHPARVWFIRVDPQSDLISIGKTSQGLARYSINFKIEYAIEEVA